MRLALFLIGSFCFAAPTVSNITYDFGEGVGVSHSAFRMRWSLSGTAQQHRVRYGTTTSYEGGANGGIQYCGNADGSNISTTAPGCQLSGLAPSTLYHFCPQSSDDGGSTWSTCVDTTITTSALPGTHPAYPVAPPAFDTSMPDMTGATTQTVASDCSDLQSRLNTAFSNQSSAPQYVVIPAGTICSGAYTTPTDTQIKSWSTSDVNTGTDRITVTSHGLVDDQAVRFGTVSGCLPNSTGSFPSCANTGDINIGKVMYVNVIDSNTIQITATAGGAAVDLTSVGSGTNYLQSWPPPNTNWVILKTDSNYLNPAGTRLDGPTMASQLAKFRQTGGTWDPTAASITLGLGTHHFRIIGAEFTQTDVASLADTSTDPKPTYTYFAGGPYTMNSYVILDRVYMHSPTGLNRIYRPIYEYSGAYMGIINSDLRNWNFWRPNVDGLTCTTASQVITCTAGTYYLGSKTCTAASSFSFTITGGSSNSTAMLYVAMDCTPTLRAGTGTTMTCTGSMSDGTTTKACATDTAASPDWPRDAAGSYGAGTLYTVPFTSGTAGSPSSTTLFGAPSAYATEGTQGFIAGWGPGPYKIENNFSEGTGLLWHFDDSSAVSTADGFHISKNLFWMDQSHRTNGSGTDHLRYMQRNGIEWKQGTKAKIDGNRFVGFWADVSQTGCAVLAMAATNTQPKDGQVSDFEVSNNTFKDGACSMMFGGGVPNAAVRPPSRRFWAHNNLHQNINGWNQYEPKSYSVNQTYGAFAITHFFRYGVEDFRIEHETVYDARSTFNLIAHPETHPIEGGRYASNIYFLSNDGGTYWVNTEGFGQQGQAACSTTAKAALDCWLVSGPGNTSYSWADNVFVAGYATSSGTPSGNMNRTTMLSNWSNVSSGFAPTGTNVSDRVANVGWTNPSSGNFRLTGGSTYHNACDSGTTDCGINQDTLESAQGIVHSVTPGTPGIGTISVTYSAPDTQPCYIGVAPTGTNTFSWTSDGGTASGSRTATASGLGTGSYDGQILCYSAQSSTYGFSGSDLTSFSFSVTGSSATKTLGGGITLGGGVTF